jgi:hypothetical protein
MPIYEDLKLRREGEREGEGVYIYTGNPVM